MIINKTLRLARKLEPRRLLSTDTQSLGYILEKVRDGSLQPSQAEELIKKNEVDPEDTLKSFANLDHYRARRTGFPEAVFAAGKTPEQVARILDDMARSLNEQIKKGTATGSQRAILATR
jgi:NCAIR mutase (PurE)-related protein